jgi:hypothetical protein
MPVNSTKLYILPKKIDDEGDTFSEFIMLGNAILFT